MKRLHLLILALTLIALFVNVAFAFPAVKPISSSHNHSAMPANALVISEQSLNADNLSTPAYMGNSRVKKFHYLDCKYAKMALEKNRVFFQSREEAVKGGYTPCKTCKP